MDEHVPDEDNWIPNPSDLAALNDVFMDNATWAAKRDTWEQQMWQNKAGVRN